MAYPTPQWDGVKKEIDREFIRTLKDNLVAASLFEAAGAIRYTRDLGVQAVDAVSFGEESGAAVSMNIPEFHPTDGAGPTTNPDLVAIYTKDAKVTERERLAAESVGVDTVEAEEKGYALAKEIDNALLFGTGLATVGNRYGILNHPSILTVDNSGTTNWTTGNDAVKDLNAGVAKLLNANHQGPITLMMNPLDSIAMGSFITNTSAQVDSKLNSLIRPGILYSKRISSGNAFLVEINSRNFRALVPRDIGAIGRPQRRTDVDEITGTMRMRWLTALGLQNRHPDGVVKVTFDFS